MLLVFLQRSRGEIAASVPYLARQLVPLLCRLQQFPCALSNNRQDDLHKQTLGDHAPHLVRGSLSRLAMGVQSCTQSCRAYKAAVPTTLKPSAQSKPESSKISLACLFADP